MAHQAVTFRAAGSLPADCIDRWARELARLSEAHARMELRQRIDKYLDEGHGGRPLADIRVAGLIQNALLHFDRERYLLHAWVIMPNHVHALLAPMAGHTLAEITHSWKSFTANRANGLLGRTGEFWQRESYDRFIRSEEHFAAEVGYMESNPVVAGLCRTPEDWPFSSASLRGSELPTGEG